jgi:hypothetical protein
MCVCPAILAAWWKAVLRACHCALKDPTVTWAAASAQMFFADMCCRTS